MKKIKKNINYLEKPELKTQTPAFGLYKPQNVSKGSVRLKKQNAKQPKFTKTPITVKI